MFILGPARSGTSAMTLALLDSGAYLGTGEGHLLPLAHALVGTIDQYYQRRAEDPHTLLGKLPIAAFQKLIRRSFVRLVADLFPTRRWLDKTPTVEMVRASVLMKELWPNARFIFMKRRVIENVLSRRRKFPQDDTERHYSDWLAVMSAWLAVRDQLGTSAIEIEHRHLVLEPDATVTTIAKFLQLPQDAAARFRSYLTERRPEQTDSEFGAVYSLERLGLNEADAARLKSACDPIMAALGYSYGESYFSAQDPAALARPPTPCDDGLGSWPHSSTCPRYQCLKPLMPKSRGSSVIIKSDMDKPSTASAASPRRLDPDPVHSQAPPAVAATGRIEKLSTEFVTGWASVSAANRPAHVYAMAGSEVIGFGVADISRPDLERARQEGQLNAYAFIVVFDRPIAPELVRSIRVFVVGHAAAVPETKQVKIDQFPTLRLFVMGSPRSGTSQLGQTLSQVCLVCRGWAKATEHRCSQLQPMR